MRRFLQLNPYDFVRFLAEQDCVVGKQSGALQHVFKRDAPAVVVMIRMGEPLQEDVIRAYLLALRISEQRLESYLSAPRRPPNA